jgi:hypothetical protein
MFAIGRAIDAILALLAAALSADLAANPGTVTAGAPLFANLAGGIHDRVLGIRGPNLVDCPTLFLSIVTFRS